MRAVIAILLFLSPLLTGGAFASDCNVEDSEYEYAKHWHGEHRPEDAYAFGLKIQNLVREKDLEGLFSLVDGELWPGTEKQSASARSFDEIFDEAWVERVLSEKPPCSPLGVWSFMLGRGVISFGRSEKGWEIFSIDRVAEEPAITPPGWTHNGTVIHPLCFARPWISTDNFEEYAEVFDVNLQKLLASPGRFLGNQIADLEPIRPGWCDANDHDCENISLIRSIEQCTPESFAFENREDGLWTEVVRDGYKIEYLYKRLKELDAEQCSRLAPDIGADCLESYLIEIKDYSGGSMGWYGDTGLYGLFDLPGFGTSVVPLRFFYGGNEALNYPAQ